MSDIINDDDLPNILVPCSLRDWFAGMALQGMLSNPESFKAMKEMKLEKQPAADSYADYAYFVADAMLKEREK